LAFGFFLSTKSKVKYLGNMVAVRSSGPSCARKCGITWHTSWVSSVFWCL